MTIRHKYKTQQAQVENTCAISLGLFAIIKNSFIIINPAGMRIYRYRTKLTDQSETTPRVIFFANLYFYDIGRSPAMPSKNALSK